MHIVWFATFSSHCSLCLFEICVYFSDTFGIFPLNCCLLSQVYHLELHPTMILSVLLWFSLSLSTHSSYSLTLHAELSPCQPISSFLFLSLPLYILILQALACFHLSDLPLSLCCCLIPNMLPAKPPPLLHPLSGCCPHCLLV